MSANNAEAIEVVASELESVVDSFIRCANDERYDWQAANEHASKFLRAHFVALRDALRQSAKNAELAARNTLLVDFSANFLDGWLEDECEEVRRHWATVREALKAKQ